MAKRRRGHVMPLGPRARQEIGHIGVEPEIARAARHSPKPPLLTCRAGPGDGLFDALVDPPGLPGRAPVPPARNREAASPARSPARCSRRGSGRARVSSPAHRAAPAARPRRQARPVPAAARRRHPRRGEGVARPRRSAASWRSRGRCAHRQGQPLVSCVPVRRGQRHPHRNDRPRARLDRHARTPFPLFRGQIEPEGIAPVVSPSEPSRRGPCARRALGMCMISSSRRLSSPGARKRGSER